MSKNCKEQRHQRYLRRLMAKSAKTKFPCSACTRLRQDCLLVPDLGTCLHCQLTGNKCSLVVTENDWNQLDRNKQKFQRELIATDEQMLSLVQAQATILAKRARLH